MSARSKARPAPAVPSQPDWTDVLASIEDGVVVIDSAGVVADLNPAAEQLVGVSAPQAVGKRVDDLFGGERGRRAQRGALHWAGELVRDTLAQGVARRRGEGLLRSRRGDVEVNAACAPLHDGDGTVAGAVLVLRDLTLQRALEATGRRAERLAALGTVALGLAHEIKNPLGGIKGAAQLLRGAVDDPELVHCTDIIIREVERLDGLVEHLRELSVPPRLDLQPVNIHRVLNDVLALQRQAPAWGETALRVEFDPSLPAVRGDRAQLTQVFLNLVKNALEALSGRGELRVSTRIETRYHIRRGRGRGQFLSVVVEDTGPGVPPEDAAQLFSPFFSTKAGGSGLGLALCHRIVAEHGGTIAHEPRPGGGARFRVTLPVSEGDVGNAR
ncbi:MAG: PAS domain-containing protein [Deltaproteobacteria bacterium]|nr:MAG: PAS domain-containing protein [Deltaproteobacteria bacterium]